MRCYWLALLQRANVERGNDIGHRLARTMGKFILAGRDDGFANPGRATVDSSGFESGRENPYSVDRADVLAGNQYSPITEPLAALVYGA